MLKLRQEVEVYISLEPIDMRKAIDSLVCLVINEFSENPQSGHFFLFFNKRKDKVKIVFWDRNGFVLHYKRMEKHRFHIPKITDTNKLIITETQLHGLLAGLDFMLMSKFNEINYHEYA
ncbi:MAG: IS66 family insertion sequence element accessory protein TnpB [Gammaproteobacteria bacterium]|nr:IS66 family insertion sequence element accessory protein TnpB [Gammaproteobacteria bacterium]